MKKQNNKESLILTTIDNKIIIVPKSNKNEKN